MSFDAFLFILTMVMGICVLGRVAWYMSCHAPAGYRVLFPLLYLAGALLAFVIRYGLTGQIGPMTPVLYLLGSYVGYRFWRQRNDPPKEKRKRTLGLEIDLTLFWQSFSHSFAILAPISLFCMAVAITTAVLLFIGGQFASPDQQMAYAYALLCQVTPFCFVMAFAWFLVSTHMIRRLRSEVGQ